VATESDLKPQPVSMATLEPHFQKWASRIRTRSTLRSSLVGLGVGGALGAVGALVAHFLRYGEARPWVALAFAGAGLVAGLVHARRQRWSDAEVALYLDARWGTSETITTALELGRKEVTSAGTEVALSRAVELFERGDLARIEPKLWTRAHLLIPLAALAAAGISVAPVPPPPPAAPRAPGSDLVKLENLPGLDRIEALDRLGGSTPEERERLKRIAEAARQLRAELAKGLERREALSAIAKLRDDIAAERMKFGDQSNRAALDAALAELERKGLLKNAAKALGEGDLVAFDEEMQRIANTAEKADREAAKDALEQAAKAARDKGSEALGRALDRERKKLEEAEAKAEALRELARELGSALGEEGRRALEEYGENGSLEAQRKLTEALERALRGLSEEERKRLAENLKKRADAGSGQMAPMTRAELEELAKRLGEKDADKRLEEQLRELARRDPSQDAARERGLGDADRGGAEAERRLGALPMPGQGQAGTGDKPGGGSNPKSDPAGKNGSSGPGGKKDEGTGDHSGETEALDGKELRSKADGKLLPGGAMHGATLGRAPARVGETANERGSGALGSVGRTEIGAVEGTDIPEEYREQVGRYFDQ
jgi:hypothetical protein